MAKLLLLLALCALSALVATAGRPARNPFQVIGRVYCDTCRAGFETSKTTYIAGAKVRIECAERKTQKLVYSQEGTTDSTGTYKINVNEDHGDETCDAMLVSSPHPLCRLVSAGRDRARVILTGFNGIASNTRFANSMGFTMEQPMSGCTELLRQYQEYED